MINLDKNTYPELETNKLKLRVLTLDYVTEVFKHFSDEHITEFMDIEPCKDLKEAEEIITYHLEDLGCRWGIFHKENNEFIGTCGFHYIRNQNDTLTAEVGFDLAKDFWGQGLMYEVMQELIRFGITAMSLDTIDATVEQENERSIKLMTRLGFTRDMELKDNLVYFYYNKDKWLEVSK